MALSALSVAIALRAHTFPLESSCHCAPRFSAFLALATGTQSGRPARCTVHGDTSTPYAPGDNAAASSIIAPKQGGQTMPGDHERFMRMALDEAGRGKAEGNVAVGSVIVQGDTVVARGRNLVTSTFDPTAHAETVALREA